ncbi:MAG: FAD/NAD(P)-binding protein [Hyphomicrobium sp.]|uniref:FAD/NAD(P)-binding protein n=1 Tax=Hyphomicrobium sp. TaxID=82 RepID=UPI0039E6F5E7
MVRPLNVLILGGGASGTLLAIHLLCAKTETKVTLIERTSAVGKGIAYGSAHPIHLLNVRAANMSAYPDLPDHFVRWLDENDAERDGNGNDRFRFASRAAFGNYLTSQLRELQDATGRLKHIQGEAVSLSRTSNGVIVTLDNFRRVGGDLVVVATGYEPPEIEGMPPNVTPWLSVDRATLKHLESILLLGTGLSMVDHVQSLIAAGYQGTIYALSRRGLLPQPHRPIEPAVIDSSDVPFGEGLVTVFRWFRARAEKAQREGSDWRAVLDGLRPHVQELWRGFSLDDQSRFVRHARPWWDVRRHRMAPRVASIIEDLLASKRLVIIAAKIVSIAPETEGGIEVRYRRRGKFTVETLMVHGVTDCTGFSIDVAKMKNPLIRNLLAQGFTQPDRLGLGIDVDGAGALIDNHGHSAPDIFAIGPLTRGAFWEIVGIPDIRTQCECLTDQISEAASRPTAPQRGAIR